MADDKKKRILVLGVGNILFTDEGTGVRAVERLKENYEFSDNVSLMDGGTLGTRLIDPIMDADFLIVLDAVLGDDEPGSVYRLTGEDLRQSLGFKNSMHDTDLVDTLVTCELIGNRPEAVVIGMEPFDFRTMSLELSETVGRNLPGLLDAALVEVKRAGGTFRSRNQA
ncbi:MAG: HyaD/HybD family hydrogenase maturation endopeptidase [Desulfovibrionaceae bacterium]|nr:HyaD/HybD family hydrogenase maturation endopeptidase [Desulfovibrionaceae bacterium]